MFAAGTSFGGQVWLARCRELLVAANNVSSMWLLMPRSQCNPIIVTAPMELLHIEFTSMEMMMELNQPPKSNGHFGIM